MDFAKITAEFYDNWLGVERLFEAGEGIDFVYSAERNVKQYGYPRVFDVFVLVRDGRMVVSYGDRAADRVDLLRARMTNGADVNCLKSVLYDVFAVKPAHSVKFVFEGLPELRTTARQLQKGDLDAYVQYFRMAHPNGKVGWIYEYFDEMVLDGGTFVKTIDGKIVSCADSPGMPYMADRVQEIGIATLPEYRGRGFALDACVTAAGRHIASGKCPIWSAAWDNVASHSLAEKVGFKKYADAIMLSL